MAANYMQWLGVAQLFLLYSLLPSQVYSQQLLEEKWQFIQNIEYIFGPRTVRLNDGSMVLGTSYLVDSSIYVAYKGDTVLWYQRFDEYDPIIQGVRPDGRIEWTYREDTVNSELLISLTSSPSNSIYFVAEAHESKIYTSLPPPKSRKLIGNNDLLVVKLGADHRKVWEKVYGGEARERISSIELNDKNELFIAGGTESVTGAMTHNNGYVDMWALKLDSAAEILWSTTIGGGMWDLALGTLPLPDGGCVVFGESLSNDGDFPENVAGMDAWVIRLSNKGEVLWKQRFGGNGYDAFKDAVLYNGKILLTGKCNSTDVHQTNPTWRDQYDFWLVALDIDGQVLTNRFYGGWGQEESVKIGTSNGRIALAGTTRTHFQDPDHGDVYVPKQKLYEKQNDTDWWIIELDSTYNVLGSVVYGGRENESVNDMFMWSNEVTVAGETMSRDGDVVGSTAGPGGVRVSSWYVTFTLPHTPASLSSNNEIENAVVVRYTPGSKSIDIQSSTYDIQPTELTLVNLRGELLPFHAEQVSRQQVALTVERPNVGPVFLVWKGKSTTEKVFKVLIF
ncbi:MAG: hypothetical protein AB7H80_16400 [Candidatus Kapaibacterium sp.]